MKTTFTLLAACAAFATGAIAAPAVISADSAEIVAADSKTVTLKVTGMTWPSGCGARVQAALKGVKGVSGAKVTKGQAIVTAGKSVAVKDMIAALKKAGYGGSQKKSS